MAKGTITGDDVLKGVTERIAEVHAEFSRFTKDYNEFAKSLNNIKSGAGVTDALAKNNELDREKIRLLTQITNLEKTKGEVTTAAQRKSAVATRTNLAAYKSLNSVYQQQSRLLNNLQDRYKSLEVKKQLGIALTKKETAEYARLRVQVIALDSALKRTDAAAGQFQRNVGNYPKGIKALVGAARSLIGAFGFTSGIFLFAAAVKDAFNRVREFDKSMQNLAGIMRVSRSDVKDLEKEIIKVAGASIKTSREVAGLAESLATLGKSKEEIKQLLKPVNDLAIGLEATSEEAAEFFVQTLNAFGAPASQAAEYADVIATIRTSTTLDFQKMRDSFQYLTPISRILGKDLAYTGAVIGVLADNGLKAENAGRLLGTAQQKLAKTGKSLAEALEEINKAQREGKEPLEVLAIASNLFGAQAAKVGAILANNSQEIEKNAQAIRDNGGALNDLVNTQLESLDAKIKILDATWEQFILTIENGNGATSNFFKGLAQGITGYLNNLIEVEEAQSRVFDATGREEGHVTILKKIGSTVFGIGAEYDELVKKQLEFNKYLGQVDQNTSLGFLRDELATLSKELRENTDLTDDQRKIYFKQVQAIEELYNSSKKYRNELESQAQEIVNVTGRFDDFGAKIEVLTNKQLEDFITKNKHLTQSLADLDAALESGPETLNALNEKLKGLRDILGETPTDSPLFDQYKKEIKDLEKYIDDLLDKKRKTDKAVLEGTIAYYEKLIKEETDFQKNEAKTAEAISASQERAEKYQKSIDQLTGAFRKLEKVDVAKMFGSTEDIEGEFKKLLDPFKDLTDITLGDDVLKKNAENALKGLERDLEAHKNTEEAKTEITKKEAEARAELFATLFGSFANIYGLDLSLFEKMLADEKVALQDYASFGISTMAAVFDGKFAKYEEDERRNRATLDAVLNDENASDKKKEKAQLEFDKKEKKLNIEKAKAAKQEALFQIAISTAVAFVKALPNIPLAIAVLALGGIQAAIVSARKIPQFFKGTKGAPRGWAWTDEKGPEIHTDKSGNIKDFGSKDGPRTKFLEQGDKIFTAEESKKMLKYSDFGKDVKFPSTDMKGLVAKRLTSDTKERTAMFAITSKTDTKEIAKAVEKAMMKFTGKSFNIHNNVRIETPRTRY